LIASLTFIQNHFVSIFVSIATRVGPNRAERFAAVLLTSLGLSDVEYGKRQIYSLLPLTTRPPVQNPNPSGLRRYTATRL
jgi:hypothetical protein